MTVVKAIRQGELREPERLMGFVRTVVRRQVAGHIERAVSNRRRDAGPEIGFTVADRKPNPEQTAMVRQQAELAKSALSVLSERTGTF